MKCHAKLARRHKALAMLGRKLCATSPNGSESMLSQLIEEANSLIIFTTTDGEALMCNGVVEFFTGYSRDEILQQGWLNLLYKGQDVRKEMFKAVMKSCLISIMSKTYEGAIVRKDGSECMLSWRLASIRDKNNNELGLLCIAHDVTDRKAKEEDIDVHGQKFKDILSSLMEYALMTTNLEGKITYYGLGAKNVFGFPENKVYLEDISLIYPEHSKAEIIRQISIDIQKNGKFEGEIELIDNDKKEFPAILTITPLLNKEGQTIGYTYVAKDITEKKKIEQQMVQSAKMAAVGQLASGVAHEINNPLLVIMGRLELLDDEELAENVTKTIETVQAQSQRIRTLVDRLLSYSKKRKPDMKPLDLNHLLKNVAPLLAYYPEFRKITWKENLQDNLPLVKGDFNQLQEVFVNLGLNACQATKEGDEITVVTRHDKQNNLVEALVTDTGSGMNQDQMQHLFDPFFTTKEKGTGLGLSICSNIIEQHKGKIDVESEIGKGTTFTIKLPVVEKPEEIEEVSL
ncbi:MAG: PAS domain S-box protein [Candidatus Omnitrophota bacterium]